MSGSIQRELEEKGFIIVSETSRRLKIPPDFIVDNISVRSVALVLTAGIDVILMTRSSLEEFKSTLESIKSSDPRKAFEAASRYARAFEVLSKPGIVYYDRRLKGWVMVE